MWYEATLEFLMYSGSLLVPLIFVNLRFARPGRRRLLVGFLVQSSLHICLSDLVGGARDGYVAFTLNVPINLVGAIYYLSVLSWCVRLQRQS